MPNKINLREAFSKLQLFEGRTPHSTAEEKENAFMDISKYRDGSIYIGYFSGSSDWERHNGGDEIVYVLEGKTDLFILNNQTETKYELSDGEYIVVPKGTWHRFVTQGPIKSLTVTPMPTDHKVKMV